MKNEAPEARENHKTGTWSRLGGSWSGSWRPGRDFLKKFCACWREDGRRTGEVGAELVASCAQDGP